MEHIPLLDQVHALANDLLLWIGFGTVVGLLAKAIMPGRDPGGPIATLMMGIGGSVIGCGTVALITQDRITPISGLGLVVAVAGAFMLLFFYKLLAGYWFVEGDTRPRGILRRPLRRSRTAAHYVDE